MQFQFKNDVIYNILRERIQNGTYPVGMKLPPETVFARELQVGKVTLRSALARLEQENLIVRMRSRGTFVKGADEKLVIYGDITETSAFRKLDDAPAIEAEFNADGVAEFALQGKSDTVKVRLLKTSGPFYPRFRAITVR